VPRRALVEQLLSTEAQVISVVAPPGYGETTLLSQLQQHSPLRTAWLSLDELDNDPSVLVSYLATAFEQIEPNATPPRSWMLPGSADLGSFLRRLAVVVSSVQTPFSLVLDHVEAIESRPSADAIAELAFNLPPRSRLVLASRRELPIPLARLRARGSVIDVGMADLAMSEREAHELLVTAGVELGDHDPYDLLTRTEGWPVGLYLASLAIKARRWTWSRVSGSRRSSTPPSSSREIGERLFVSRHTVKTQAISTYRKLGVSARSEAVLRAEEIGLLSR
jgi:LuxR family transcriptional regulator, maltose regulon positive regulatory protein